MGQEVHRPKEDSRRRALVYALILALLGLLFVFKIKDEMADFDVCHRAGRRFLRGEPLYRPSDGHYQFKYPPGYALVICPLSLLPVEWARALWFYVVSLAVLLMLEVSGRLVCSGRPPPPALLVLTFLVMAKFYGHELTLGQVNAVMVLLLVLMLHCVGRGRCVAGGGLLGLATVIKPYAFVFFPWLLVARRYRALLAALAVFGGALVLPCLRYGLRGNLDLVRAWRDTLAASTPVLFSTQDNVSIFGFLAKWLPQASPALLYGTAFTFMTALYLALLLSSRAHNPPFSPWPALEGAVLLVYIPLFSPLGWDYTLLSSTLGVMVLIDRFRRCRLVFKGYLVVTFILIGATVYDLMGPGLYSRFMKLSVLTPVFVLLAVFLIVLRTRPGLLMEER